MELKNYLLNYGFHTSIADPSLFIYTKTFVSLYLLVYVDDIIVTSSSTNFLSTFITHLSSHFSLKDLGPLSYFLGVEVTPNSNGLLLSQTKYIYDLLPRHNMADSKPSVTPMSTYPPLTHQPISPIYNPTEYRAIVGSL